MKTHISLNVSNIEKTKAFYEVLFNEAPVKLKKDYVKFDLKNTALNISFIENPKGVNHAHGHYGLIVENKAELDASLQRAEANKLDILNEGETVCCYASQNKFWVTDPDGYRWEIYQFLGDVESTEIKEKVTADSACCDTTSCC